MGNGTTCNLQLVKQNAKKKGEVSTGPFLLSSFFVFSSTRPHCPSVSARLSPTPTTAATTTECESLFTGIKSLRMEVKDLGGPEGRKKRERKRHGGSDLWRQSTAGSGRRKEGEEEERQRRGSGRIYLSQQRHRSPHPGQPMQMLDI